MKTPELLPCPHKQVNRWQCDICRLEDAEQALCEISILTGNGDPSDGEGTHHYEIVEYVRQALARHFPQSSAPTEGVAESGKIPEHTHCPNCGAINYPKDTICHKCEVTL